MAAEIHDWYGNHPPIGAIMGGELDDEKWVRLCSSFRQAAIKAERERIVDWLREQGEPMLPCDASVYADAIASGEHEVKGDH